MNTKELLDSLLALFQEKVPQADFSRAYPGSAGTRLPARPMVTGEVAGETVKPGSEEAKYLFRLFLPEGEGADRAEDIFAAMRAAAGESYPGFSAISRGGAGLDKTTGLLAVDCFLSFLSQTGGGGENPQPLGRTVVLGGREYLATGVKTSISRTGKELVSVGETSPFAVLGEKTEYTVELEGIDVSGLENLAGFTAQIGETVYQNCRWKSLSDVLRRAVFVSCEKG